MQIMSQVIVDNCKRLRILSYIIMNKFEQLATKKQFDWCY